MKKLSVGDKLLRSFNNSCHEWVLVTKVGTKYFTVQPEREGYSYKESQHRLNDWLDIEYCKHKYTLYANEEEYTKHIAIKAMSYKILSMNRQEWENLGYDTLCKITKIIEESQIYSSAC